MVRCQLLMNLLKVLKHLSSTKRIRGCAEIGIQATLRSLCAKAREGSSPSIRTNII